MNAASQVAHVTKPSTFLACSRCLRGDTLTTGDGDMHTSPNRRAGFAIFYAGQNAAAQSKFNG